MNHYQHLHQTDPGYALGGTRHAAGIIQFMRRHGYQTVLDYGCGKGALVQALRDAGVKAYGYDPYASGWSMADVPWTVDLIVSTDVIEHLGYMELSVKIPDMLKLAIAQYHVIDCTPAISPVRERMLLPDGRNVHVTLRTPREWVRMFRMWVPRGEVNLKLMPKGRCQITVTQ
jgi:cyclopropane fatty-acyl-phospholipid synthase-like methyltransferase